MKNLISWIDIPATDIKRAIDFYNSVLNLKMKVINCGVEKMACFPGGEGAISSAPNFNPSKDGVIVSLNAGNKIDEVIEEIVKKGGEIVQPKTKIEAEGRGYFALFIDTEGNKMGVYGD